MAKTPAVFAPTERVTHHIYGPCTIVGIENEYTVIDFDKNGRRKFVTSMVQLERTTIEAPPPASRAANRAGAPDRTA